MITLTHLAVSFLLIGIFTSVTVLAGYQIFLATPALFYSYQAIQQRRFHLPKSSWFLLAFAVVALISLLSQHSEIVRVGKNYGRLKYEIFCLIIPFALVPWIKSLSETHIRRFLHLFLLTILGAALYNIIHMKVLGLDRMQGLTDTMRYGYGMGMISTVLIGLCLRREWISRYCSYPLLLTTTLIGIVAQYLTYTRGGLLSLLVALPFVFYFWRAKWGVVMGFFAGGVVLTLVGFYLFGSGDYNSRFLVNKNNGSDTIRRSQWQAAIIAFKEKPLLGYGIANFHSQLKRIKEENNLAHQDYNNAHSHNILLETLAGTGILGFLAFSLWFVFWAWELWSGLRWWGGLILPLLVAVLVGGQFEVITDANNLSMIYFLYVLTVAINRLTFSERSPSLP